MYTHSIPLKSALLILGFLTNACFAQSAPLTVGSISTQKLERDGSQSDKLLIKANDHSLALDLNRSVGLRGLANLTADGILIAGPYVLDAHQGKLIRQSRAGYFAVSPQLDGRISGRQVDLRVGEHHWHCHLPLPPIAPRGLTTSPRLGTTLSVQGLLVFGTQTDSESGITTIRPMTLKMPGCKVEQSAAPLAFDHGMLVPQASAWGWWTYSVSEPKLALSTNGINWRYPSLPAKVKSLLSAFVDDQGVTWIAVSVAGSDDDFQMLKQPAGSNEWQSVQSMEAVLPQGWLEGRMLLKGDARP